MRPSNHKSFLYLISFILVGEGLAFLLCIPVAIYYKEVLSPFYLPGLISLGIGLLVYLCSDRKFIPIQKTSKGFLLVTVSWFITILIGTAPYVLSNTISSRIDIAFETISGFTTTGSSIVLHVEDLPRSIVFWRSLTHWLGGLGGILTAVIFLPEINVGGDKIFSLKSALGSVPSYRIVSRRLALIYCTLTLSQILMLQIGGMDLFENLCYSMGTVSTGSFSPITNNLSAYSHYTQYIMILFMLFSGFSYVVYYLVIAGKTKLIKRNEEKSLYVLVTLFTALVVTLSLYFFSERSFESSFRNGLFQVISFASTNGYSIADYKLWPEYNLQILCLLLLIGGCSGSASGGIKVSRLLIFFKNIKLIFKKLAMPTSEFQIKYNGRRIDGKTNLSILTFITLFGFTFLSGTLVLSAIGLDLRKSAFLAISALSTLGHNLEIASLPDAGKITLSTLMFIGRLEVYPVLVFLIPSFYTDLIDRDRISKTTN